MNPLLSLRPPRGSKEAVADLHRRLAALGVQPDNTRTTPALPPMDAPATIGPPTRGVGGLPVAPLRAPEGIPVDFGKAGRGVVPLEMLENVAALSSAPSRVAGKAARALADQALPRLSALHNTTANNLRWSLDLGGFPVPSIAVVPEHVPFTDFGDITLIGKQSLGDPATSRVYSADAYTTRVPLQASQVEVGGELRDWNLDNVAEAMRGKGRLTEGKQYFAQFDPGPIRAANARIFRELEPMRRDAAARIRIDAGEYDKSAEQLRRAVESLAWRVEAPEFSSGPLSSAYEAILQAAAGRGTPAGNLRREGLEFWLPPGISKDAPNPGLTRALAEFDAARNRFLDAPVKYFEAKPQRGVRFDEFAGAVVPEGTDAALIERLQNAGLQVEPYRRGIIGTPDEDWVDWEESLESLLQMQRKPTVERFRRLLNEQGGNTLFSLGALGAGLGAGASSRQDNR